MAIITEDMLLSRLVNIKKHVRNLSSTDNKDNKKKNHYYWVLQYVNKLISKVGLSGIL